MHQPATVLCFAAAIVAVFVFSLVWNGVVHMVLLAELNHALDGDARPTAERSLWLSLVLTAAIAVAFVASMVAYPDARAGPRANLRHGLGFGLLSRYSSI